MKNSFFFTLLILSGLVLIVGCSKKKAKSAEFNKLLEQGQAKINTGDYQGAIADLEKAIQLDKKNPEGFYWTGRAYMATEKPPYPKTLENFQKTISLDPNHALAYCSMATVYDQNRDEAKACEAASKSIAAFEKKGIKPEHQKIYQQAMMLKNINCK
ncbi:MAG: tetratricopeptide repeat protein [Bacteroidia bacterium]|nr:tetratricopeptide repeat protein [Bacteroidia bacterium]MDW8346451.1 tetratricopeptide repeat protein [Bacteroidia bacterium]